MNAALAFRVAVVVVLLLFAAQGGWIGMVTAGGVYALGRRAAR